MLSRRSSSQDRPGPSRRHHLINFINVSQWMGSLSEVFQTQEGRNIFMKFLRMKQDGSENLLIFYNAVTRLKKSTEKTEEKCQAIYDDHISNNAKSKIDIKEETRQQIEEDIMTEKTSRQMFLQAEKEVFDTMSRKFLSDFVKSNMYIKLKDTLEAEFKM